ncbi:MAG: Ref family recombination enhancement nuclease [Candidatus Anammoxibacter sp.]
MNKSDTDRYRKLTELGCIVCKLFEDGIYSPPQMHHLITFPKKDNKRTIPLCLNHHNSRIDCEDYTSRHPHFRKWEERYETEEKLLEITNELINP